MSKFLYIPLEEKKRISYLYENLNMKKTINEEVLNHIIDTLIKEQSVVGATNKGVIYSEKKADIKGLDCVPNVFRPAINELKNKGYNPLFLKASLGIIGRESDFGSSDRFTYLNPLKTLWAFVGGQSSIGYGQVKPETAEKYGMDVSDLNTAIGSIKAVYSILINNFKKARSIGYQGTPSSNFKNGTGNSALDMAIISFNLGEAKIVNYCETTNPDLKRNCLMAGKTEKLNDGKTIKVLNKQVPNYIPNYKSERWDGVSISSHGYLKEVSDTINKLNCFG